MTRFTEETVRRRLARLAAGLVLISGFALWPLFGHASAYLALIFSLFALVLGWDRALMGRLLKTPFVRALVGAFVIIALAFLLQPGQPSLANIADFLPLALTPLLALAISPLADRLTVEKFSQLCLLATVLCAIVGLYGLLNGVQRTTAPGFSPIHFADLAVVLGFLSLGGTLVEKAARKWMYLLGPVLAVIATIAAETRAALIVALGLALVYGVVALRGSAVPRLVKIALPLVLCGLVVLGFAVAYSFGFTRPMEAFQPVVALLRGEIPSDTSALYRVEMYRAGIRAFFDAPLFGHGWHSQIAASMPYLTEIGQEGYALEGWGYIHNDALSLTVACGLFGLIAYLLMLAAPLLAHFGAAHKIDAKARLYLAICFSAGLLLSGATDVLLMVEVPKVLLVLGSAAIYLFGVKRAAGTHT
ncbi:O-antigen ligase family protein [Devosia sp. SD17-2]|uniref:O-antigen ligase family protein n=1 Tax=Devosia sp. SD17-2 TaxID=2976459 RepID=UPI0023D80128|nr:O-antigen ligase family protein [Devosia sp. SD17-2]WEJ33336.1 O-antigen ligase family protein [Devosia sp. SD17-2]